MLRASAGSRVGASSAAMRRIVFEMETSDPDDFMTLLLDECRSAGSTLVFVSHDERLASRFDTRLSLSDINRAAQIDPAEVAS